MGADVTEGRERNQGRRLPTTKKTRSYAPYADIQHRIIDSQVFKDLSGNDCRLLLLLAYQLSVKQNENGRLVATQSFCSNFGFGSHHTLKSAIDRLIELGLLVQTLSFSAGGGAALYAVPWRPLGKSTNDLFLENWRERICSIHLRPCFTDLSGTHPHAAIDHEVIKSPAFADLKPMSCKLLIILARQLTKPNNNGHLQATFKYCKQFGFASKGTLNSAIDDLIAHGFVHLTHRHGRRRVMPGAKLPEGWNKYALTWREVDNRHGLDLNGFNLRAWMNWEPSTDKTSRQKSGASAAENGGRQGRKRGVIDTSTAENGAGITAEIGDYVHVPLLPDSAGPDVHRIQGKLDVLNSCAKDQSRRTVINMDSSSYSVFRRLVNVFKKVSDAVRKACCIEIDNKASGDMTLEQLQRLVYSM